MFKEGDFIRVNYIGRVKETGEIFDLTYEDLAKEKGLFSPKFKYRPIPVVIGAGFLLPALEEELKKMDVGQKKKVVLPPEKAFGVRSPSFIKLIHLNEFKKQGIEPYPGMEVTVNNLRGRVLSVSGGRVRVDFNHPLAGKEVEYELEVVEKIDKPEEQVFAFLDYYLQLDRNDVKIKIVDKDKTVEIVFEKKIDVSVKNKKLLADLIKKWVKGIEKVRFIEEF